MHRNDSTLSERGKKQAKAISKFVNGKYSYDSVFCSVYHRAIETANEINKHDKPLFQTSSFSEYFLRDDGSGAETTDMALSRSMSKFYSIYDVFESVVIVAHSAISKSILQALLNITFEDASKLFNTTGEVHVLRYDYKKSDNNWREIDSFIPNGGNSALGIFGVAFALFAFCDNGNSGIFKVICHF